ncbi:competence protein ComEC [Polymorphobacter multimanifer]|uniref:Competence protein ComEC n=1 Tax=Polymorphobacter multimanifer TaxID=1070431 RepID=A0A841L882_9SPHN|nr:competence protein ComEC [Polymorphobacter multimanifer]
MTSRSLGAVQTAVPAGGLWPGFGARFEALIDGEREALPLWLPVALGAGIALWFTLPWAGQRLAMGLALAGLGGALVVLRTRWPAALLLMAALGMAAAEVRDRTVAHRVLVERTIVRIDARVLAVEPRAAREQLRLVLALDDPALPERVRVSLRGVAAERAQALPGLAEGARVQLRAMLMPPMGPAVPGGYDAARALWFEGVGATGIVLGRVDVVEAAPAPDGISAWMAAARRRLNARILAAVPGEAGAVAAVFVTGDRGAVPLETAAAVRDSGLAHLLSISGLHMAVVVGGVIFLVRRLVGLWPWMALRLPVRALAMLCGAVAGLGYTLLAGGEVPTVRSLLATLIVLLGLVAGRDAISLRLLGAAAVIILLARPEVLMGPSFQMSFAAVAAIIALYEAPATKAALAPREDAGVLRRLGHGVVALVATGLVAEMVLAPIGLFHFQQSGLFGVGANLLAIPLASFAIMPALGLGLVGDALGLGAVAFAPAGWAVMLLLDIAYATAGLPGAVSRLPVMPVLAFPLLALGGLWLVLWRTRLRLGGVPLVAAGAMLALFGTPPDLLVSRDGRHVALVLESGELAFLRPRTGEYLRDSWGAAVAGDGQGRAFDDLPGMDCSRDACLGMVGRLTLFATRSHDWLPQATMEPACTAADIVVSERRLPDWCAARWLRLDRTALTERGAVAVWLRTGKVVGARDGLGDHRWR